MNTAGSAEVWQLTMHRWLIIVPNTFIPKYCSIRQWAQILYDKWSVALPLLCSCHRTAICSLLWWMYSCMNRKRRYPTPSEPAQSLNFDILAEWVGNFSWFISRRSPWLDISRITSTSSTLPRANEGCEHWQLHRSRLHKHKECCRKSTTVTVHLIVGGCGYRVNPC